MGTTLIMLQTNSNQPFIFSSPRLREQIGASFEITLLSHWVKKGAECLLDAEVLPDSFWVSDSSGKVIVRFTKDDGAPESLARSLIREVTLRALADAPGLDVTGVFIRTDQEGVGPADLDRLDRAFGDYSLSRRPATARFPQFPFLERGSESAMPAVAPLTKTDTERIYDTARAVGVKPSAEGRQNLTTSRETRRTEEESDHSSQALDDFNAILYTATKEDAKPRHKLSFPARVKRAWALPARLKQLGDVSDMLTTPMSGLYRDPTRLEAAFQEAPDTAPRVPSDETPSNTSAYAEDSTPPTLSSVGVVHIDGNGVGAIMRDLGKAFERVADQLDSLEPTAYKRKKNPCDRGKDPFQWFIMEVNYRLDGVVKAAVAHAWKELEDCTRGRPAPPVVPVLVGGDDLTVYVEGQFAIPFAEAYIRHYERLTGEDDLLSALADIAGSKKPGPLTASAGVAIVGRNFPFHIAYDLAGGLVSRGKKLGKKAGAPPCSTIDFHVLRDATVLDPEETLDEYKGRTQRPFLVGCYAPQRTGEDTPASSGEEAQRSQEATDPHPCPPKDSDMRAQWARILRAVAAFDGKGPCLPDRMLGDPFPRARANRIVKLLAEKSRLPGEEKTPRDCLGYVLEENNEVATQEQIDEDATRSKEMKRTKRCAHPLCAARLEWEDAQDNARIGEKIAEALASLPSHGRPVKRDEDTEDHLEQLKWFLDLIDLSETLPDGYVASYITAEQDGAAKREPTRTASANSSSEGDRE